MTETMNGAVALLRTAEALGAQVCFANPGTTELVLVRALEEVTAIRPVLGLFEGVCTGAADGYARVSGRPALTLLHLGPGFANGVANLHNARRAHSAIINIIGDHATWHLPFDAPLTSDIESLASPVSGAVIRLNSAAHVASDVAAAFRKAASPPGAIVTLIAPTDVMEGSAPEVVAAPSPDLRPAAQVPEGQVAACAQLMAKPGPLVLLIGGAALGERGLRAAARIQEASGARLLMEPYPAIVDLGGDLPHLERLAYFPDDVIRQLGDAKVILAGAREPISYFGYEGQPSQLVHADRLTELASPEDDTVLALEQLADKLGAAKTGPAPRAPAPAAPPPGFSPAAIVEALIALMPEGTIVSLEGSTLGGPFLQQAHRARRHRVMTNTGGAIGQGLPCAVGAAIACPEARVISLQSDGSAHYTLQALWTMAREGLPITVIIAANHRYGILQTELRRSGADLDQPVLDRLTQLDQPRADWVALAQGYGVQAVRAADAESFRAALQQGLDLAGPFLIQAELP
ncbi:acetolactate synthase large subunit [Phenylobacterium montanum]|uniref:Acetolactate synthase large subunit n=1 Tax=Phenylobacterium montanum TaxID=2823693 RepID=A0A975G598_9CAUL|nr:acetolactate synthase large subunit [Caulobacter sp. S6]QUD90296.1 acetolactate synthase large subunit [Caulobacter sp. S6]